MLNTFNSIVLSYKGIPLFLFLFHSWPGRQPASNLFWDKVPHVATLA